jgi:hypothetical protein
VPVEAKYGEWKANLYAKLTPLGDLGYMQNSEHISRSDQHVGNSAQTHTIPETVEEVSFSNRTIKAQVAAEASRIRSAWLERNARADLTETSFNDQFIQMLVDTLDAHAKGYLSGVERRAQIPEYIANVQRLGEGLYNEAKQKTQLTKDASLQNQLLSPESRRKIIDETAANLLSQTGNITGHSAHKVAVASKRAEAQLAKDIERWLETRDEMLFRIEIRFAGRYQYWQAEALERVREKEEIAGQKGRDPLSVSDWEDVEIEFLSDERVQIWTGNKIETRNYGDMGFMDKRDDKPNQSWVILRTIAELGGTLADSAAARKKWPAVEKQIQRIRKALREHFALHGDPIPFVHEVGFRTRFKIRCAASFKT